MKIESARALYPFEAVAPPAMIDLGAPSRSWRPAESALEVLPGWWVAAGYWDRDAVEAWFARPT